MIQLNINKLPEKLNFAIMLDSDTRIMGSMKVITENGSLPLPADVDAISGQTDSSTITGTTTSKLIYIKRSFAPKSQYINVETTIRGTDIKAMIIRDDAEKSEYSLYRGTGFQINYVDSGGITTFSCKPDPNVGKFLNPTLMLAYPLIIDEPKLDSNLFINRGVNNVFESFKRIKTSSNLQELQKTGFGFFKFYKEGIN